LLIDYATGIYSGSVYNDKKLLTALPGEFTCNWRVSVVKVSTSLISVRSTVYVSPCTTKYMITNALTLYVRTGPPSYTPFLPGSRVWTI
jgi:hypothetical protein